MTLSSHSCLQSICWHVSVSIVLTVELVSWLVNLHLCPPTLPDINLYESVQILNLYLFIVFAYLEYFTDCQSRLL